MKKCVLFCCLLLSISVKSQTWSSVGSGTDYRVLTFISSGIHLYVGGDFSQINGISANSIVRFDGTNWYNLGGGTNGEVSGVCFYNNELNVCGSFSSAGGNAANNVAKWNGSNWTEVNGGVGGGTDFALTSAVYNNNLYVGGKFLGAGTSVAASRIAKWDGVNWAIVGTNSGISMGATDEVTCLAVYNGELYAGGNFSTAGGVAANDIAKWNDTGWTALSGGPTGIWALAVYNNELYVGHGSAPRVSKWNGTSWSTVGGGMNNYVHALTVYNGELYAGGDFTIADGNPAKHIAKWDGTSWTALGPGTDTTVLAMYAYNGDLYVGGEFTQAGGLTVNHIAKWNNPVGVKENSSAQVNIYPNPASDKVVIDIPGLKECRAQLTNSLGQVVSDLPIRSGRTELSAADLENGVYTLQIISAKEVFSKRIIVQH